MSDDLRLNKNYTTQSPTAQNTVDIFKGEWSSKLPDTLNIDTGGKADLFEDQRIKWAQSKNIIFKNKKILELGPLEGGHTWMMEQLGASEIISIEAHKRSFLKCLIIKEILGMKAAKFLYGNFEKFLEKNQSCFDICLASGVLYHSTKPLGLLKNISRATNCLILWTHYFSQPELKSKSELYSRFLKPIKINEGSFQCQGYPLCYDKHINFENFCGGPHNESIWLKREDIVNYLEYLGFKKLNYGYDHLQHPNGPSVLILATK